MIIKSLKYKNGYWINLKFVLIENWKISKFRFTTTEQQQFENKILTPLKIKSKMANTLTELQAEIQTQQKLVSIYETQGNTVLATYHKAKLNRAINSIEIIKPKIITA